MTTPVSATIPTFQEMVARTASAGIFAQMVSENLSQQVPIVVPLKIRNFNASPHNASPQLAAVAVSSPRAVELAKPKGSCGVAAIAPAAMARAMATAQIMGIRLAAVGWAAEPW